MLAHLIRKEILDHLLSLRFLILSGVGALVIWLSLFSGFRYYRESLTDYRLSQTVTELHVRHHVETGWLGGAGQYGYPVQKPPTPMSIFVRGLEPTLGRTGYIAFVSTRRLNFSPMAERPLLGSFPPLDLGVIVQVVLSLFVLLQTYDAVCGEKEGGTLRLLSSFPVPRDRLLLGKAFGALIPVLAAFGLPLVFGIGVICLLPDLQFQPSELARLGLVVTTFVVYLTAFTCAGILGSCLAYRATTSFIILIFFWVGAVIVLPRLSLVAADLARPAPSSQKLLAAQWTLSITESQKRAERLIQWEQEFHARTGKEWWEVPDGREGRTLLRKKNYLEIRSVVQPETKRMDEAFQNLCDARLDLAVRLGRFSPAFALNNAIVRLAGTGIDRHRRFLEVFKQTRFRLTDWYWSELVKSGLSEAKPETYGRYSADIAGIPRLAYVETWPGEDVETATVDVGVLAVWGLLFFSGAYVAMLRYDLR